MAKIWELILILALAGMVWIVRMDKKAGGRKNKNDKGKENDGMEGPIQSE